MNRVFMLATTLLCTAAVSACSGASAHSVYVARSLPNSHVLLVPELRGGWAGWSLVTSYRTPTEGGSGGVQVTATSTGPIFAEGGCGESETSIEVYALTTSEVAAVSLAGGMPIPTTTNSTLPDGLRAVAVEVLRHNGRPSFGSHCPRLTPLDANGKPIVRKGGPGRPQAFKLPGTRKWEIPGRPPSGACGLTAARLPQETNTYYGYVASRISAYRGLIGKALLSCVDTLYIYHEEHHLTAAALLNAAHPGTTPPALPDMRPVAGYPGIFETPGSEGERVARRIPGAWLVVEEEDRIGLRVPIELLEDLHATIRL
jgi:hypothetical protein